MWKSAGFCLEVGHSDFISTHRKPFIFSDQGSGAQRGVPRVGNLRRNRHHWEAHSKGPGKKSGKFQSERFVGYF
jgi:hypothetical protein